MESASIATPSATPNTDIVHVITNADAEPLDQVPAQPFVHLRLHSEFSIHDGIVRIDEAIAKAQEDGMPALALTDLANAFGMVKFYSGARAKGIKPIVGCDVWLESEREPLQPVRTLLLVQNLSGYLNLCRLLSRAYIENQQRGKAVIPWGWLESANEGLLCVSGFIPSDLSAYLMVNNTARAQALAQRFARVFSGRFYIELQRDGSPQHETLVRQLCELAATLNLPVVATHPIQFLNPEDHKAHEARVCIAEGEILSNPRRERQFNEQQYFKNTAEMQALFADVPTALANTVHIAKRCNLTLTLGKPRLPDFPTPEGLSVADYLRQLSQEGLDKRMLTLYPNETERAQKYPEYLARLTTECDTIINMGFPGYFLIVQDFINWGKHNGVPVGPGRGSGAGSLVAYSLGITDLDPLAYDLLFERFLNPERVSMPDFDIDFCQDNRDKVIDYVKQRYGRNAVSQIATFGTLGAKAVIRDVGRVLDMPYNYCDGLSKLIPQTPTDPWDLARAMKEEPTFKERVENEEEAREIIKLAQPLEGLTRNVGMHAGGVLIAPGELTDFCPLYCADGASDSVVSQFDKDDVEAIGLVKFDFLGLRNLTILDWAMRAIRQNYSEQQHFDLQALPLDDPAVYTLFAEGNTTAVFQSESRSAKDLEKKLKPDCFEDIIALMALNRPGPLGSGMVDDFIARKREQSRTGVGKSEWYFHPDLTPILKSTYGVIVYQEQVMLVAQILAGYSLGGADLLRRAMGKKKPEEMAKQRTIFTQGAVGRGVSEALATQLFDLMEKFAEYGFNKSHSAAYALIAYQTAWLKAHYPAEFMAATMSSDMDDTDKVKIFVEDAQTQCKVPNQQPVQYLQVLPPCVNASQTRFVAVKLPQDAKASAIRYGLAAIKGTGVAACDAIVAEREHNGPFTSIFDFVKRVDAKQLNRRALEALARAGAFDAIHPNRAQVLEAIPLAVEWAAQQLANRLQSSLFGDEPGGNAPPALPNVPAWSQQHNLQEEKSALGYYFSGHLFDAYREQVRPFIATELAHLKASKDPVWLCGIVSGLRTMMTRRGKMAIVTLDDGSAALELSIFNEQFEANRAILKEDHFLVVLGRVADDVYTGGLRVTCDALYGLESARAQFVKALQLHMNQAHNVQQLMHTLKPYTTAPYRCPVEIVYRNEAHAQCMLKLGDAWQVEPSDQLLHALQTAMPGITAQWRYA